MSRETMLHLNTNTLIGFTDKRGNAWHYRAVLQGDESNHYPGAIPVADVKRRLLNWQAVPRRVAIEFPATFETMTHLNDAGEPVRWAVQADRQAISPSNRDVVMGLFKDGYKIHQYDAWLLDNVATILDDDLSISSAGLLRDGALAWVEVSVPDTFTTPEGVAFRPNLLAATSFDGSLATTIKRTVQATVCDNTLAVAQREKGQTVKIRHSSNSLGRIADVREALAIVHSTADDFAAEVAQLTQQAVSPLQFKQVIDLVFPVSDPESKRAVTNAQNKIDQVTHLYHFDPRCQDWTGTAFGVLQTLNTWRHHEQGGLSGSTSAEKRAARAERNAYRAITGETQTADANVVAILDRVLTG